MADLLKRGLNRVDRFQQRHTMFGFPYAVMKKFGEDQAGNLAAIIGYYAFLSIFPLLLVFTSIIGFVLQGNSKLQHSIEHGVLSQFPIIGQQASHQLQGSGVALAIGLVGALWGGLGVANTAQSAFNSVWEIPMVARPGFFPRLLRSLLLIAIIGSGLVLATGISALSAGASAYGVTLGTALRVIGGLVSFAVDIVVFTIAFRALTSKDIGVRAVLPGATIAAASWQILQLLGGYFVAHQIKGASHTYGTFAVVIGLLAWFHIQAQVTLYAAEVNVVRAYRLWPRAMVDPPKTDADRRAYAAYAGTMRYRPEQHVATTFKPREEASGDHERSPGP